MAPLSLRASSLDVKFHLPLPAHRQRLLFYLFSRWVFLGGRLQKAMWTCDEKDGKMIGK